MHFFKIIKWIASFISLKFLFPRNYVSLSKEDIHRENIQAISAMMKTGKRKMPKPLPYVKAIAQPKEKKNKQVFCYCYSVQFPKRWQECVCRTHSMSMEYNNPLYFSILGRKSRAKKEDLSLTRLKNLDRKSVV